MTKITDARGLTDKQTDQSSFGTNEYLRKEDKKWSWFNDLHEPIED